MKLISMLALGWLAAWGVWPAWADDLPVKLADSSQTRQIAELVEQLGDGEYAVRQRAQQDLIRLGFQAFDALAEAEKSDDPEIAMQAAYLLRLMRIEWTREGDPRQVQVILKDYEALSDEARLARIRQLSDLPGDLGLPWLCRLVRYEKSVVVSKQAALAIIHPTNPLDETGWKHRAEMIPKMFEGARRAPAQWVLIDQQAHTDPAGMFERWSAVVEAERQTLDRHPQETHSRIVMDLLRHKIDLLDRLGRSEENLAVMRQIVECERGDSASLVDLVDWLVERKAWTVLDEVAVRFAASFEIDAFLMYALCEARLAQGKQELGEQTAEKALAINGDRAIDHKKLALQLIDRGLMQWADRELRYAIKLGPMASETSIIARNFLCESLHDRQLDREAGEVLKELIDAADNDPAVNQRIRQFSQVNEKNPNFLRASMYYFFACDAQSRHEQAQFRELLDKAIEQDPTNVDALIAAYRATGDEPKNREKIMPLLKEVVDDCRKAIDETPDNPVFYNQVAWIVANTEGDFDEAVRLSHKSVELQRTAAGNDSAELRRVGGYLDTLGHCYFAKRDFDSAVKYQSEAARIDPHSQAIARQLKVFREALASQPSRDM